MAAPTIDWSALIIRFWWLQGAISALTLLGLAEGFTAIPRSEFLRFFHSIAQGWNKLAILIGQLIAALPWLPNLPAPIVNMIIIFASVHIPAAIAIHQRKEYAYVGYFLVAYWLMWFIFLFIFDTLYEKDPFLLLLDGHWLAFLMPILLVVEPFRYALFHLRGYRRGVVSVLGFTLTLKALYFFNTPVISKLLIDFSCSITDNQYSDCGSVP